MRIKEEFRHETVINKSRFIACAAPCRTEEECREYIEKIRREFTDATHVCTAYVCGENNMIQRSSDNHEPAGTAGVPMLEAIKHSELSDLCVCVVRYFGGIKLGAGGLIRAYSSAVTEVLQRCLKVEDVPFRQYRITYPYDLSGTLEGWLRRYTEITDLQYDDKVTATIETERDDIEEQVRNISRGEVQALFISTVLRQKVIE